MGWAEKNDSESALYLAGAFYTVNASVTLYAVWNPKIVDTENLWYQYPFNTYEYFQCPWYALGRVGEVHNIKVEFDGTASGGWWVKTIKPKAYTAKLSDDGKEIVISENEYKNVKVITNPSEANIKGHSIVCFLFYIGGDYADYYGHIQFIEKVEKDVDGITQVYFSDSNSGRTTGEICKLPYNDFISQYNCDEKKYREKHGVEYRYNNEPILQGFIQFD